MRTLLPKEADAQDIIHAFSSTTNSLVSSERKWEINNHGQEFQYEPGSARQVEVKRGMVVRSKHPRKLLRFLGFESWGRDRLVIVLEPLTLTSRYTECDVKVKIWHVNDEGGWLLDGDPPSELFESVRSEFEQFLATFFTNLQTVS